MAHEEYLRRNQIVCSAYGADAAVRVALERLCGMKKPPKWLVEVLLGAHERTAKLPNELARWRDAAHDRPPPKPNLHHYEPNPKYPWFCKHCGYAEHERLKHHQPPNAHAQVRSRSAAK